MILEKIKDTSALAAIEPAYDRAIARCSGKTLYVTCDYVASWLATVGKDRPFEIILAKKDAEILGICPLVRQIPVAIDRRLSVVRSQLIGPGLWGYADLVCEDDDRGRFFATLVEEVLKGRHGDFVDLGPLLGTSKSLPLYEDHLRKRGVAFERLVVEGAPYIDTSMGLEAFDKSLAGRKAVTADLNRCRRRLEEIGPLSFVRVPDRSSREEVARYLEIFLDMYDRQWPTHRFRNNPAFKALYLEFAHRASQKGFLDFYFLYVGDRPVAAHYGFLHAKCLYYFTPTYEVELQKCSPGKVLLRHLLERAFTERWEFDFQNGVEPYKLEWTQTLHERVMLRIHCTAKARLYSRFMPLLSKGRRLLTKG